MRLAAGHWKRQLSHQPRANLYDISARLKLAGGTGAAFFLLSFLAYFVDIESGTFSRRC